MTGNKIKIHRIVGATDSDFSVNPAQIDRQMAGSFVSGCPPCSTRSAR